MPVQRQSVLHQLANFIDEHKADITERWLKLVQSHAAIPSSGTLTRAQLIDHLPLLLTEIERLLRKELAIEPQQRKALLFALLHGHNRMAQGYDLDELLHEFGILRVVISEVISQFAQQHNDLTGELADEARMIIIEFINNTSIDSMTQFAKEREREVNNYRAELEQANRLLAESNAKLESTNQRLQQIDHSRQLFTRTASHEMRNILSALSGATRILGKPNVDEATRNNMLAIQKRNLTDMEALLDQLLDYSTVIAGKEPLNIAPVDLTILFAEMTMIFQPMAMAKELKLAFEYNESLPQIKSDQLKVKRIVGNLLANAIKYTERGTISLSAQLSTPQQISIIVTDTGPGIEPDDLAKIFNEFYRASNSKGVRGTGLGLAIVKQLLETLHGDIKVDSQPGQGSRFEVTLPLELKKED